MKPRVRLGLPKKLSIEDFTQLKLIGRGGFGRVLLVRKKDNQQIYAMKVLKKRFIVAQNQVTHTTTERNVMVKLEHPFLTKLHFAFQDEKNLYFVMDFIMGVNFSIICGGKRNFLRKGLNFILLRLFLLFLIYMSGVLCIGI